MTTVDTPGTETTGAPHPDDAPGVLSTLDEGGLLGERLTVVDADNATLTLRDPAGRLRTCVDLMSAYASVNFGHRNRAVERSLSRGSDLAALFYPQEAAEVAEWLAAAVAGDGRPRRVLYQVGGSFAVSSAIALARRARPGRVLAVDGAFHGLGVDALAVTTVHRDSALQDTGFTARLADEVEHLSPGELPTDWTGVSCVIYEPVQGANGYVPLDADWLRELEAAARAAGAVLISDEIQCGYYRHGHLSPSRALGLDPDVVLFGKSLTNGMYPLSAVVYKPWLEEELKAPVHLAHTFQTGALGFTAAREVARFVTANPVAEWADRVGAQLRAAAEAWQRADLVRSVHLTGPTLSFEPVHGTARQLVRAAFERGVLPFTGGAHGQRVRIAPPLTIPAEQLDEALRTVEAALPRP
ncbi:aminotransferase class III-fold pyridoxal phosphate-dependent enzyme [Kitasatospora phosalacinea]|uniref:aminotransferase class III-fold pyridoxal phosphate-dependent enzyme n=1 Tax=Kitasatospora phosalacinea TaxID=2065 RepID=UPI0035DF766D